MKIPKRIKGKATASHARSPKQEKEIANRIGGKVTRGSGCGNEKGDVRIERVIRIEAKTTKHRSFSVTRDMLEKIEMTALCAGELPALAIEFITEQGKPIGTVCVVPEWVLDIITQPRK